MSKDTEYLTLRKIVDMTLAADAKHENERARLVAALENARIALTFYRMRMDVVEKGNRYPFGQEAEDAVIAALKAAGASVTP